MSNQSVGDCRPSFICLDGSEERPYVMFFELPRTISDVGHPVPSVSKRFRVLRYEQPAGTGDRMLPQGPYTSTPRSRCRDVGSTDLASAR
jgi:hypothetical protein